MCCSCQETVPSCLMYVFKCSFYCSTQLFTTANPWVGLCKYRWHVFRGLSRNSIEHNCCSHGRDCSKRNVASQQQWRCHEMPLPLFGWHCCHCLLDQAAVLRMPAGAQASANLGHSGFHGVFRQTTGVCQTSAFLEHDDPKQSSAFQGST